MAAARAAGVDALLVTFAPDVRYLTGFTGSSGAVALAGGKAVLFTDGRYTAQAKAEATGMRVVVGQGSAAVQAVGWLAKAGVVRCGFDAAQTTVTALEAMKKAVPAKQRRGFLAPLEGPVAKLREVKDADEIAQMRRAAALGCRLFGELLEYLEPGAVEAEVALALEVKARLAGAEGMSFETIVASGARSSLPHGRASAAKLPRRGFVVLDFGVVLGGYCSDMTRTVHLGRAGRRERAVYDSVLEAQAAALAAVRPGTACGDVDEAARAVLRRAGLDKAFSHSTGHGVGLEIHEGPRIAAKQTQPLQPGMVITIEPGVYLEGEFGIRIEDTAVVTETGCEVLTRASRKQWMEL